MRKIFFTLLLLLTISAWLYADIDIKSNPSATTAAIAAATNAVITELIPLIGNQNGLTYYLIGGTQDANSSNTYYSMSKTPGGTATVTQSFASVTNNQYLAAFITPTNQPGITVLKSGIYNVHIHARKTSAGGTVGIKAELYIYHNDAVITQEIEDTEIETLTTSQTAYDLSVPVSTDYTIAADDRIVIKIKAVNVTTSPNLRLYTEGDTVSHITLPVSAGVYALGTELIAATNATITDAAGRDIAATNAAVVNAAARDVVISNAAVQDAAARDIVISNAVITDVAVRDALKVSKTGDTMTGELVISNNSLTILYKVTPTFTTNGIKVTGGTHDSDAMDSVFVLESANYSGTGYASYTNTINAKLFRMFYIAAGSSLYIQTGGDIGNPAAGFKRYDTTFIGSWSALGGLYVGAPATTWDVTTNNWNVVYTNTLSSTASGQLQLNSIDLYDYTSLTNKLKEDGVY